MEFKWVESTLNTKHFYGLPNIYDVTPEDSEARTQSRLCYHHLS